MLQGIVAHAVLCFLTVSVAISLRAADETPDPFVLDGARNILEEAHFGIVNGKLTSGIPYRRVAAVSGLWAPPFASSDFGLDIMLSDQPIPAERYTWRPFFVERAGTTQGVEVETVTALIRGPRRIDPHDVEQPNNRAARGARDSVSSWHPG